MLNKIIQFSLQNRLFILIASVLLMIGGLYQAYHTEVDVFPDLNAPTVVVMTEAGGMAAEEVEQLVTFPIETAVNGAPTIGLFCFFNSQISRFCIVGISKFCLDLLSPDISELSPMHKTSFSAFSAA